MAYPTRKSSAGAGRPAMRRPRGMWCAALLVLLLAGCSTVPLPRWSKPVRPLPADAVVQDSQAANSAAAPYGPAVAARFPDPAVVYATPGLTAGRDTFSTNAEVQNWLRALAERSAAAPGVRTGLLALGNSQRGAPLEALVLTRAAATDPATLADSGLPTVLLIGQQHGNEPASAEALMVVARELTQGLLAPLLQKLNVIVVPRANPDGAANNERMTADGVDLNRDHLLLKTPEARALARLVRDYRPLVVVDAHEYTVGGRYLEKFGAVQRYDALLQYATTANMPEFVTKAAEEWVRQPLVAALQGERLSSEWYYTTSSDPADRRLSMGGVEPDTSRNVNGLKNAVSLLLETRGVGIGRLHIQRRVHTQVVAIGSVLRSTAARGSELRRVREFVDRDVASQACAKPAVLQASLTPERRTVVMLDPATGTDRALDVDWMSALTLQTQSTRLRPCGYWLAADEGEAVEKLRLLGLQVFKIAADGPLVADGYREAASSLDGRQDVRGVILGEAPIRKTQVTTARTSVTAEAGSYYVPVNQPLGSLAVAALEPDTQSSFYANHVVAELDHVRRVMTNPSLTFEDDR